MRSFSFPKETNLIKKITTAEEGRPTIKRVPAETDTGHWEPKKDDLNIEEKKEKNKSDYHDYITRQMEEIKKQITRKDKPKNKELSN